MQHLDGYLDIVSFEGLSEEAGTRHVLGRQLAYYDGFHNNTELAFAKHISHLQPLKWYLPTIQYRWLWTKEYGIQQ